MSETNTFQDQLRNALDRQAHFLDEQGLPKVKADLRIFQSSFEGLYNILLKKSLIDEDPYKYDQKISEIAVPSQEPFLETERRDQLSRRLSAYHSQLDFLNDYYQFSVEFLTLKRIKRIVDLIRYLDWAKPSAHGSITITGAFFYTLEKVRQGSDSVSVGIINDALKRIPEAIGRIQATFKDLTKYQRERYKLDLRREVFGQLPSVLSATPETLKKVKRLFQEQMAGKLFFPELVKEVLAENDPHNGAALRAQLLDNLTVPEQKRVRKKTRRDDRLLLLEAVRSMCLTGKIIQDALAKVKGNLNTVFGAQSKSRFRRWLQKMQGDEARILTVDYFDSTTSTTRTEKINFEQFSESVEKKSRLFNILTNKMSTSYQKLEIAQEEQIFAFLSKNIRELQLVHRRLEGLNAYLISEAGREQRDKLRGIKIELSALKNSIIKTNKRKYEYVAIRDEETQLKKMGIDV